MLEANSKTVDRIAATWVTAYELSAAELFERNKSMLKQAGDMVADADLMISSITLTYGATLVTRNTRHYERIPHLLLEDWICS